MFELRKQHDARQEGGTRETSASSANGYLSSGANDVGVGYDIASSIPYKACACSLSFKFDGP